MLNKKEYKEFCINNKKIPIFSKDWWLDAVCGEGNWDVIIIENGGKIVATLPYYIKKSEKLKYKMITMPQLTQKLGIYIKYPKGQKYAKKLSYEKKIFNKIIKKLPEFDIFKQNFDYSITNWLPFYWNGFQQTTRYTYIISDLSDLDKVFSNFRSNIRTDIRKAKDVVEVYSTDDLKTFYELNEKTFSRQDLNIPYSYNFLKKIDEICSKNDCRKMFFAKDARGDIHAAIYIIWDNDSAYYLLSGSDPDLRNSGATSLLLWKAINFASTVTQKFDFEGSMIEPVERFFRAFGAQQVPYFHIYKDNRNWLIKTIEQLKNR
jgi:lipid II:glycine glycyltransferase (peptidoglycan interpeptide bridge formation enzyme)